MSADITDERAKSRIQPNELSHLLYGKKRHEAVTKMVDSYTVLAGDYENYNRGRIAMIKDSVKVVIENANRNPGVKTETAEEFEAGIMSSLYQLPYSIHVGMFVVALEMLGTEAQKKTFLEPAKALKLIGCYAQTEIGHGSDVQSLETTATFDPEKDEFILNTPSISAAKYWPGDLGLYADHALVSARLISHGNFLGVHNFIVQLRDEHHKLLPGFEAGDIGPKYGFHTKDNGYLIMKNIRIPRKNMLRRYVTLTKQGDLSIKGNPKIGYATMMMVRKMICCSYFRVLGSAVVIAGRYSMIRKQFKNDHGEQQKIIEYQTQKNKILSCLADYYALALTGLKIGSLCDENFKRVQEKEDDSLMAETHNCLCLGKAFVTDTIIKDIEICRLACGGHGFHHYSGLPSLLQEITPFTTLEGENTVMYLQLSRYILKSNKNAVTGKKQLGSSVQYLKYKEQFLNKNVKIPENHQWNIESMEHVLVQAICLKITQVNDVLQANEAGNSKDTKNYHAGLLLVRLSQLHALLYYLTAFREKVQEYNGNPDIKACLHNMCLLFGINAVQTKSLDIVQTGLIPPEFFSSIEICKQKILNELRPYLAILTDGMGFPQSSLRSSIISGNNIYQNLFNKAKSSEFNQTPNPAAFIVKQLQNIKPKI